MLQFSCTVVALKTCIIQCGCAWATRVNHKEEVALRVKAGSGANQDNATFASLQVRWRLFEAFLMILLPIYGSLSTALDKDSIRAIFVNVVSNSLYWADINRNWEQGRISVNNSNSTRQLFSLFLVLNRGLSKSWKVCIVLKTMGTFHSLENVRCFDHISQRHWRLHRHVAIVKTPGTCPRCWCPCATNGTFTSVRLLSHFIIWGNL